MSKSDEDHLPEDVVQRLLESLGTAGMERPGAALRARVLQSIASGHGPRAITTVRASEGEWAPYIAGVTAKVMVDDGARRSWLARLEPGACIPAHRHAGDEEVLLLEGSCLVGGLTMQVGDYQFSPSGTCHEQMTTTTGCLLFLRSRSPEAAHA